jgi:hypothetical protein
MRGLFLVLLATPSLLATAQMCEEILLDGKPQCLYACPLEQYRGWRQRPSFRVKYTSNHRGYVGTWRIEDHRLYLTKIEAELCTISWLGWCRPVTLEELFPAQVKRGRVEATWFSGTLRIPRGKILMPVHMGFGTLSEEELQLEVVRGRVMNQKVIDNRGKPLRDPLELGWEELQKMGPELGGRPRD